MDPIDELHRDCIEATAATRADFAAARARATSWEPAPLMTPVVLPVYLDEVERFRPWFRS